MISSRFESFRNFVIEKHASQLYGDKPYITHLDRVVATVKKHASGHRLEEALLYCAMGHDLIEDTDTPFAEIRFSIPAYSALAIEVISDPVADTREERKRLAYQKYESHTNIIVKHLAATVKVADRTDNMLSCLDDAKKGRSLKKAKMYLKEQSKFIAVFGSGCLFKQMISDLNNIHNALEDTVTKQTI